MSDRPGVAAFDFDGTLARRDTLVPFLRHVRGTPRVLAAAARSAVRSRDRDALKVAVIGHLFRGVPADRLARLGEAYVPTLVELLRPEMVERVRWHQAEGHAVVIVSASLGAYLRPLAARLGLDAALAVELVAGADGLLTGELVGQLNTRGPEKVARLRVWADQRFGPATGFELWAYGDSSGDEELLALAEHPTWVGRRAGEDLRRSARPGTGSASGGRGLGDRG
ncbi:MAG TPA: HAD-IB family hydrolase [Acidimicrobiales bacterium]|nr:HAD-IB family hydrolase [Acidimicrobiales bacterium]